MEEKKIREKLGAEFPLHTCDCGKQFVATTDWVYKIKHYKPTSRLKYYCCYTCWRKAGGGNVRFKA